MNVRPPADPVVVRASQQAVAGAQAAVDQAKTRVDRLYANPDTASAELAFARQQLQEAKAAPRDAQAAADAVRHPMTPNERLDNTQTELGIYSLFPFVGPVFAAADAGLTAARVGADIHYGDTARITGDIGRAVGALVGSLIINRLLGGARVGAGGGSRPGGHGPVGGAGLPDDPVPAGGAVGSAAAAAVRKPLRELGDAALEDFPSGAAFSGAYNPATRTWRAFPSGNTVLKSGEVPSDIVPRNGGHGIAAAALGGGGRKWGFTMFLREDGSIAVDWYSAGVNGGRLPRANRGQVMSAIARATGRVVVSVDP